jgi:hypothetical protein
MPLLKLNQMKNFIEPKNWWNRDYAIEWWKRNGHFNEDLYLSILIAKENENTKSAKNNQQKNKVKNESRKKQFIFFRFLPIRKWLGIKRENMVEA